MAEAAQPLPSYLLDEDGKVVTAHPDETPALLSIGYVPAGKQQIEEFKKEQAFHEKYGTTGQQVKTVAEGAAQALTLGTSTFVEKHLLGVNPQDIKGRQEENPVDHTVGTILGVAAPLILSGGAAAPLEAGAEAGVEGVSALGQLSRATAPGLISKLGEATGEGVTHLLGEGAETVAGRIVKKAVATGAGSAIEGAAYGAGQVVHEKALGDPNLTASRAIEEIGLSSLLGGTIGIGTGALGKLIGEGADSKLGAKLEEWADKFEGNQNIKTAAGPGKGQAALKGLFKKMSPGEASKLGREAGDLGLVSPLSGPAEAFERSSELMDTAGQKMGDIIHTADVGASPAPIEDVISRARSEILKPLEENPLEEATANKLRGVLDSYEERFASQGDTQATFRDLHGIRKQVSDKIFGLRGVADPEANALKHSLHDLRTLLSDEIDKGLTDAKLPEASLDAWKTANREYQVAATINQISEKGMAGAGLSGVPLSAILTSGAGLIHGGPLGAAALGGATMLAKRFGPQALAAGARVVRNLVDDGAAEGLASRTADAIAEARQAEGLSGVGLAARKTGEDLVQGQIQREIGGAARAGKEAGAATRAGAVWGHLTEKLGEPVGGPAKDLLRDVSKEHLAERGHEGTPVETVAALSQLERTNQRVANRVSDGVSALVRGAPRVARGEAMAGVSKAFSKSPAEAHTSFTKRADKVRQLAANPQMMLEHLDKAASDIREHAPQTAQALQVAMSRCVAVLNQSLPPQAQHAPLEKPLPPSPDQVARFQRCYEAVEKPSVILKQAAAGTLTPDTVAAVKAAHPQQFQAMQMALLQKLSGHRATIPYVQRQMISLIMGRDMDGTSTPAMIQASQAAYAHPAEQPQQRGIAPTSKGMGRLTLATRMQTPVQAAASRGLDE
jgi:hypothetical protein